MNNEKRGKYYIESGILDTSKMPDKYQRGVFLTEVDGKLWITAGQDLPLGAAYGDEPDYVHICTIIKDGKHSTKYSLKNLILTADYWLNIWRRSQQNGKPCLNCPFVANIRICPTTVLEECTFDHLYKP